MAPNLSKSLVSIARSWTLVSMIVLTAFSLLLMLDARNFVKNDVCWVFFCPVNFASFAHLGLQIKSLKTLAADAVKTEDQAQIELARGK